MPERATIQAPDPARVRANLDAVRERVAAACTRAGRSAGEVELLAATKYVSADGLAALVEAGITLVGENVAADLVEKHERFGDRLVFDFIGHLQSRKTRLVLPRVRLIHSVESESVLRQLERHADGRVEVLLEVNVAGEGTKYGLDPAALDGFLEAAAAYPSVRFAGLMTMPPLVARPEQARPWFAALRELAGRLRRDWGSEHPFETLSMGTSQDFEVAAEEGATLLRLGGVLYA
jgi:PLP dependent protein